MAGSEALWVHPSEHKVVGACLASARRRAKLTQQELARRLDKPQSFVSDYERGQRRLVVLIAQSLGSNPSNLFEQILRAIRQSDEQG